MYRKKIRLELFLDFNTFKIKYAETMTNYQKLENYIKRIYAYMCAGDVTKHIADIEKGELSAAVNSQSKFHSRKRWKLVRKKGGS